ncbi:unnamed protein product [Thelazia callipaeda]|uniref:MPN domain-containing protein n=1 Tax=Thelazia callipaeda TaxID=103827 RepID=A0A0N5CKV3_THECL|nr:unnamed protein product [Thelazia callipaeda]
MELPKTAPQDLPKHPDTCETLYISSLALLKMLRHGRAGVPMEVMGLMLGEFVDDFTINVVDVFAMPQSGTGVSVEAVDPVYQTKMLEMLNRTGRTEMVVGWYHSHPGFGCWLSGVDIATQRSFEALSERAVAVVVDPIQSVKGKVVIDAFRTAGANTLELSFLDSHHKTLAPTEEPRQTTSNLGHLVKHSIVEQLHGLGKSYYSIMISFKPTVKEQKMLQSLQMKNWVEALRLNNFCALSEINLSNIEEMVKMITMYNKELSSELDKPREEQTKGKVEKPRVATKAEVGTKKIGCFDPKRRLAEIADNLMKENIVNEIRSMIDVKAFQ